MTWLPDWAMCSAWRAACAARSSSQARAGTAVLLPCPLRIFSSGWQAHLFPVHGPITSCRVFSKSILLDGDMSVELSVVYAQYECDKNIMPAEGAHAGICLETPGPINAAMERIHRLAGAALL